MDLSQFQQLIAQHGGLAGATIRDPLVDTGIPGAPKEPNANPVYRYTFNDGTHLEAQGVKDLYEPQSARQFSITDWGTAAPSTKRSPTGQLDQIKDPRSGEVIGLRDPISGQVINLPAAPSTGAPNTIVYIPGTQIPVGMYDSTGKYRDLTATEQKALGLSTGNAAAAGLGGSGSAGRVRFPDEIAQNEAQTGLYQAQADKIRADMARADRPETGLLLDNYLKTIDQVQQMLADGKLQVGEADGIVGLLQQNMQAAMAGTTPFQQAKQAQDTETQRAQIGQSLLNQRVSSGLSLANSLSDQFSSNLGTLGWGLAPGQTVKFNPFQAARQAVNEQGGGPEAGNLATALLQAARPAGMAPSSPATSAPAPTASGLPAAVLLGYQAAKQADQKRLAQPQAQEVAQ